jgi:hypothetical protein
MLIKLHKKKNWIQAYTVGADQLEEKKSWASSQGWQMLINCRKNLGFKSGLAVLLLVCVG